MLTHNSWQQLLLNTQLKLKGCLLNLKLNKQLQRPNMKNFKLRRKLLQKLISLQWLKDLGSIRKRRWRNSKPK